MDADGLLGGACVLLAVYVDPAKWKQRLGLTGFQPERAARLSLCRGYVLATGLLGDVADGGSLFADDGADILRGHQQSQGDVGVRRLAGHPGARGAAVRAAAGSVAGAPAVLLRTRAALQLRVLVGDVGDTQCVVFQLVSIELLDGSEVEASFAKVINLSKLKNKIK